MDLNDNFEEDDWKSRFKKRWDSFWELVLGLVGLFLVVSLGIWISGAAIDMVKGWFKSDSAVIGAPSDNYTPPKPSRPRGLVHLATTGEEKKPTYWYLRADTVLGPRTKRLFWVNLDYSKNKSEKYNRMEMFIAVNCETMEMRVLSSASYKTNVSTAFFPENYAFDKAKVEYPVPNTGMMASYEEVCKEVYDKKS